MRGSRCKFCYNYKSRTRIVSKDRTYDEVSCPKHTNELEKDADKLLGSGNGKIRMHISSTGILCRGDKVDWSEDK